MVQPMKYPEVKRIPVDEAKRLHERGEAVIVDVRSREAFDQAHVKGAVHMPAMDLPRRFQELPRYKTVITY